MKRYRAHAFYDGDDGSRWVVTDTTVPPDDGGHKPPSHRQEVVADELPKLDAITLAERMNREVEREQACTAAR